jgi:hypothetical protein
LGHSVYIYIYIYGFRVELPEADSRVRLVRVGTFRHIMKPTPRTRILKLIVKHDRTV